MSIVHWNSFDTEVVEQWRDIFANVTTNSTSPDSDKKQAPPKVSEMGLLRQAVIQRTSKQTITKTLIIAKRILFLMRDDLSVSIRVNIWTVVHLVKCWLV